MTFGRLLYYGPRSKKKIAAEILHFAAAFPSCSFSFLSYMKYTAK